MTSLVAAERDAHAAMVAATDAEIMDAHREWLRAREAIRREILRTCDVFGSHRGRAYRYRLGRDGRLASPRDLDTGRTAR